MSKQRVIRKKGDLTGAGKGDLYRFSQCDEQYKEYDKKTIDALISSGRWSRIKNRRDLSPYVETKKTKKLSKKK